MALAFGNVFNLLVRRFVAADEVEGFDLGKVKERIRGRFLLFRERVLVKWRGRREREKEREKKIQ